MLVSAALGVVHSPRSRPGLGIYPEVAPFVATPEVIRAGDSATLSWTTRGVVSVVLESIPESQSEGAEELRGLPPTGSITVHPRETTAYFLRCETVFSGRACAGTAARVEVKQGPPQIIESGFGN